MSKGLYIAAMEPNSGKSLAVLGVVVNRFNVSMVAFNYHLPSSERYFPSWMEVGISVFIVTVGIIVYRFIVSRMPVLYAHPDYDAH